MTSRASNRSVNPVGGARPTRTTDPGQELTQAGRRGRRRTAWVGPVSARVRAALAPPGLVVTATGAGPTTSGRTAVFTATPGALFPSWETLPHERLRPAWTPSGARLTVLRRTGAPTTPARPAAVGGGHHGPVAAAAAGGGWDAEPVTLAIGGEADFDDTVARLVELASRASTWWASAANSPSAAAS